MMLVGVLISMQQPTQRMRDEAASAGSYVSPGWRTTHPKIQLLTVGELLAGKRIDAPPLGQTNVTFKRAPRSTEQGPETVTMGFHEVEA